MRRVGSIANAVRNFVISHPFIKECLALGLINYSALARYLLSEMRRQGREASLGAIKMALIRLRDEIRSTQIPLSRRIKEIIASSAMELQTDLIVISVYKSAVLPKIIEITKIMERARFFQLTQGTVTFTIIIASEVGDEVIEILGRRNIVEYLDNQTAIVIVSPEEITKTPGVVALISSVLAGNGINITQIISCYRETVIVCSRDEALKAYAVLEELITTSRKELSK